MSLMYVKSKKSNRYGEVIAKDDSGIIVKLSGLPQKKITQKNFDENFVEVSQEEAKKALGNIEEKQEEVSMPSRSEAAGAVTEVKEDVQVKATEVPEVAEEIKAETAKQNKKKEKEDKKATGRPQVAGDHPLWFVAKNTVEDMGEGHTVGEEGKVKGFRSFKVNGNMFCNINYNKNGITLWVRQDAVKGLSLPTGIVLKSINHMFDGRIHYGENTPENIKSIQEVLAACSKHQIEKKANTAKAKAEKKKAEKEAAAAKAAAEKAAKAAEAPKVEEAAK